LTARITFREKEYEIHSGMTVRQAIINLGLQPEAVLPTRSGELITDDEILREGDHIRLVAVISGG